MVGRDGETGIGKDICAEISSRIHGRNETSALMFGMSLMEAGTVLHSEGDRL